MKYLRPTCVYCIEYARMLRYLCIGLECIFDGGGVWREGVKKRAGNVEERPAAGGRPCGDGALASEFEEGWCHVDSALCVCLSWLVNDCGCVVCAFGGVCTPLSGFMCKRRNAPFLFLFGAGLLSVCEPRSLCA